jgi:hypothetical protein
MDKGIIALVKAAGFKVYMQREADSWLYFVGGNRIGYLQNNRIGGISLSTVHMPNVRTGTGFGIADDLSAEQLTPAKLAEAFINAPRWASADDVSSVRKWRDFDHFRGGNSFNAKYQER